MDSSRFSLYFSECNGLNGGISDVDGYTHAFLDRQPRVPERVCV